MSGWKSNSIAKTRENGEEPLFLVVTKDFQKVIKCSQMKSFRVWTVPENRGPKGLESAPVSCNKVTVVAQQGAKTNSKHRRHEEDEQYMKLAVHRA